MPGLSASARPCKDDPSVEIYICIHTSNCTPHNIYTCTYAYYSASGYEASPVNMYMYMYVQYVWSCHHDNQNPQELVKILSANTSSYTAMCSMHTHPMHIHIIMDLYTCTTRIHYVHVCTKLKHSSYYIMSLVCLFKNKGNLVY